MKRLIVFTLFSISQISFAGSFDASAKIKINRFLLAAGVGGAFPGVSSPLDNEMCILVQDALIGVGLLHGKSDSEIATILAFPGISAEDISPVVEILSETESQCSRLVP